MTRTKTAKATKSANSAKSAVRVRQPQRRGRGRPSPSDGNALSRESILACALEMCRSEPLHDISIVRVASRLGVTPALIHYYLGGRDRLTSGVMNLFYRALFEQFPPIDKDWHSDITQVFHIVYAHYIRFGGAVAYVMSHNRFRLFQLVDKDERDYGAAFFERIISSVCLAGLPPQPTAMYAHLLLQHVLSSSYQQISRQMPEDHQAFLISKMRALPGVTIGPVFDSFAALRGADAFDTGISLILDGIGRDIETKRRG